MQSILRIKSWLLSNRKLIFDFNWKWISFVVHKAWHVRKLWQLSLTIGFHGSMVSYDNGFIKLFKFENDLIV